MNLQTTIRIQAGGPGSGCRGENCGRPTLYHGTDVKNLHSIIKHGLKKRGMEIYLSSKKSEAHYFARHPEGVEEAKKPYAIIVVDGSKAPVKNYSDSEFKVASTFYSGKKVPAHAIKRIEIYDRNHKLRKVIRSK